MDFYRSPSDTENRTAIATPAVIERRVLTLKADTGRESRGNLTPTPAGCSQLDHRRTPPTTTGSLSVECPFIDCQDR
jgi:hypothetical protein